MGDEDVDYVYVDFYASFGCPGFERLRAKLHALQKVIVWTNIAHEQHIAHEQNMPCLTNNGGHVLIENAGSKNAFDWWWRKVRDLYEVKALEVYKTPKDAALKQE